MKFLIKILRNKFISSSILVLILIVLMLVQGRILVVEHAELSFLIHSLLIFSIFIKGIIPFLGIFVLRNLKDKIDSLNFTLIISMIVLMLFADIVSMSTWTLSLLN